MPGRHQGSTNKNQNQNSGMRNQGNDDRSSRNAGPSSNRSGSSTPGGQRGGSSTQGQHRGTSSTQGQNRGGSSTQGQHRGGSSAQHTGGRSLGDDRTKEELYAQAKKEGIEGRSHMTKEELIRALRH